MAGTAAIELEVSTASSNQSSSGTPLDHSRSSLRTRILAFASLCGVVAGFGLVGRAVYAAARDSFVAPIILSPDSDVVIANKLKMSELDVERTRAAAEIEGIDADLSAAKTAIARLEEIRKSAANSLGWTSSLTAQRAQATGEQLKTLSDQRDLIEGMLDKQRELTKRAGDNVSAGIISQPDYEKEQHALDQLHLALLENDRATQQSQSAMRETALAQRALARGTPAMPELTTRQEQMIRLELEVVRLESETRAKLAQRSALVDRVAKLDELTGQLKSRPIFQAAAKSLCVAFVPYTQIEGVTRGADVYSCVWGLLFCTAVGTVSDLVPGEVAAQDPWGTPARGQFALLDLRKPEAAKSKTLRVRSWTAHAQTLPDSDKADLPLLAQ